MLWFPNVYSDFVLYTPQPQQITTTAVSFQRTLLAAVFFYVYPQGAMQPRSKRNIKERIYNKHSKPPPPRHHLSRSFSNACAAAFLRTFWHSIISSGLLMLNTSSKLFSLPSNTTFHALPPSVSIVLITTIFGWPGRYTSARTVPSGSASP